MGPAPVSKLFEEPEIAARVEALAGEIVRVMAVEFVVIGVLKGSFVFLADLVRALARAGATPDSQPASPRLAGTTASGIETLT